MPYTPEAVKIAKTARAWEHIDECIERLAGHQLATEFRQQQTWLDAGHLRDTLERERALVHVTVDAPPNKTSAIPAVWAVTNPKLGIFRLDGRNLATWDDKAAQAASNRFDYDYSDQEREQIAEGVNEICTRLERLHINNNYQDQGQRNAKSLERIIRDGVYKRPKRQDQLGARDQTGSGPLSPRPAPAR